jgi:hypothetical protein
MTSGKYFNKGVKALDAPHIGHVIRETPEVFGGKQERYDIPKKYSRWEQTFSLASYL